jgi:hypothetical protein
MHASNLNVQGALENQGDQNRQEQKRNEPVDFQISQKKLPRGVAHIDLDNRLRRIDRRFAGMHELFPQAGLSSAPGHFLEGIPDDDFFAHGGLVAAANFNPVDSWMRAAQSPVDFGQPRNPYPVGFDANRFRSGEQDRAVGHRQSVEELHLDERGFANA